MLHLNEHIQLWNLARIRHIEARKFSLKPGERGSFTVRSAGFLCISKGSALTMLNRRTYSVTDIHIFHMPKKSYCEMNAGVDGVEYVTVGYEADLEEASTHNGLPALLAKCNPFETVYDVIPHQPVILYDLLGEMLELSLLREQTVTLQLKGVFYQWLSQVIGQYHSGPSPSRALSSAELVTMTLEYMLKHYSEPHTLDTLALAVGRSSGYLSNCFKQVLDRGPIDCLIRLRIRKACELLAGTKLPLRTVAAAVGYQDAYYFSNAFKKQIGLSPQRYRRLLREEDVTSSEGRNPIVDPVASCYIPICDNENHYQHKGEGSDNMFNNSTKVPASLLLAFGLLLGGCGSGAVNEASPSAASSVSPSQTIPETSASPSANTSAEASTRVVATSMGEVEVPAAPERVVTDFFLGYLLELGVKPVGTNRMFMENPYLEGQVEGIADLSDNLEAIVSLNPDLIVTGDAAKYEAYAKIAPTVYLEVNANIREQMDQLGVFLGKSPEASAWLATFEEKLAKAKERVKAHLSEGETVTVFDGGIDKQITLYGNAYTGKTIHGELDMPMNENVVRDIDSKVGWMSISNEVVDKYAGDHIFMAVDAKAESYDYAGDSIWGTLPAVINDELYEIDGYRFYFSDPISVMGQIEDVADMMDERAQAKAAR